MQKLIKNTFKLNNLLNASQQQVKRLAVLLHITVRLLGTERPETAHESQQMCYQTVDLLDSWAVVQVSLKYSEHFGHTVAGREHEQNSLGDKGGGPRAAHRDH